MADDRAKIVYFQFPGPVFYFCISEAMEREARFPSLDAIAAQYVRVSCFRGPQGAHAKLAVFEDFGMTQCDLMSRRTLDSQPQPTDEVLTKIENGTPGRRSNNRYWCNRFDAPHWRSNGRNKRGEIPINQANGPPTTVIVIRFGPTT